MDAAESEMGFLVLDAAVRRFMVSLKRINAIVFIGERVTPVDGGGGLHLWLAPVYNNYPRQLIPDYSVFSLKRDKWGSGRRISRIVSRTSCESYE